MWKGEKYKEENTPGMDILTIGEEFVPKLWCGHERWRGGKHPCGTYLPPRRNVCAPLMLGGSRLGLWKDWSEGLL